MRTLNVAGALLLAVSLVSCYDSTGDKAREASVADTVAQIQVEHPDRVLTLTATDVTALQTVHITDEVTQEFFDVSGSPALSMGYVIEEAPVDRWRCTEQHHPISTARKPPTPSKEVTAHSSGGPGLIGCDCPPGDPIGCYEDEA